MIVKSHVQTLPGTDYTQMQIIDTEEGSEFSDKMSKAPKNLNLRSHTHTKVIIPSLTSNGMCYVST